MKFYLESGSLRVIRTAESPYIAAIETINDFYNKKWDTKKKLGEVITVGQSGFKFRDTYEIYFVDKVKREISEELE